jgi:Tetracyclin repressor-like, C-terminal domain
MPSATVRWVPIRGASQLLMESEKRTSNAAMVATETALDLLHRAGFDGDHASAIVRMALFTGIALVMSEPGNKPGLTEAETAEHLRQDRVRLALLPPDKFPRLVAWSGPMTACDNPDFHYRTGIDIFVAGVEALARG